MSDIYIDEEDNQPKSMSLLHMSLASAYWVIVSVTPRFTSFDASTSASATLLSIDILYTIDPSSCSDTADPQANITLHSLLNEAHGVFVANHLVR